MHPVKTISFTDSQAPQAPTIRDWFADVLEFHRAMNHHIEPEPGIPDDKTAALRIALIQEEFHELIKALNRDDLIEIADGAIDLIYVILGTLASYGIDPHSLWQAVHESNMAKLGGPVREDGKRLKPPTWRPPDIARLLAIQEPIEGPVGEGGEA